MSVATVTSKAQVTIPKDVREALGIEAGSKLMFVRFGTGYLLKPADMSLSRLAGSLKYEGPPLTDELVEERMAAGLAEKYLP